MGAAAVFGEPKGENMNTWTFEDLIPGDEVTFLKQERHFPVWVPTMLRNRWGVSFNFS